MYFSIQWANYISLVAHEKISDANLMHDHQESMSKSQMTVKQQKEEKHSKYTNYR